MTNNPMDAMFIKQLDNLVQKDDRWIDGTSGHTYCFHVYKKQRERSQNRCPC